MLNRYYEADNCKKDIETFCNMVCGDRRIQKSKIAYVAKNVLFLKKFFYFYVDNNQTHYYSCLISDMLLLEEIFPCNPTSKSLTKDVEFENNPIFLTMSSFSNVPTPPFILMNETTFPLM